MPSVEDTYIVSKLDNYMLADILYSLNEVKNINYEIGCVFKVLPGYDSCIDSEIKKVSNYYEIDDVITHSRFFYCQNIQWHSSKLKYHLTNYLNCLSPDKYKMVYIHKDYVKRLGELPDSQNVVKLCYGPKIMFAPNYLPNYNPDYFWNLFSLKNPVQDTCPPCDVVLPHPNLGCSPQPSSCLPSVPVTPCHPIVEPPCQDSNIEVICNVPYYFATQNHNITSFNFVYSSKIDGIIYTIGNLLTTGKLKLAVLNNMIELRIPNGFYIYDEMYTRIKSTSVNSKLELDFIDNKWIMQDFVGDWEYS